MGDVLEERKKKFLSFLKDFGCETKYGHRWFFEGLYLYSFWKKDLKKEELRVHILYYESIKSEIGI